MRKKLFVLGWTAFLACLAIMASRARATVTAADDKAAIATVKMINFTYSPDPLTVPAGTTVRWVNYDDDQHNVVSDDKSFKSKLLDKNQEYSYTFAKKGTYRYICSIHPKMIGRVVVE
jgi:plastocyanin